MQMNVKQQSTHLNTRRRILKQQSRSRRVNVVKQNKTKQIPEGSLRCRRAIFLPFRTEEWKHLPGRKSLSTPQRKTKKQEALVNYKRR